MDAGQVGYDAYKASTGGKTYDGRDMPTWEQVQANTPHVAKAWVSAALAIVSHHTHRVAGEVFDFGTAIALLKLGHRVARKGWNGKGMWIALTPGSTIGNDDARAGAARELAQEHLRSLESARAKGHAHLASLCVVQIGAHIDMRAADGTLVIGWLASQTDMLAEDWVVLE